MFFFKRQIAAVISAALTFSAFSAFSVNAFAESDVVSEVKYVYDYVDSSDVNAIKGAAMRLNADISVDKISGEAVDRLVRSAEEKISSDTGLKKDIINMLAKTMSVYYVTAPDELGAAVDNAKSAIRTDMVGDAEKWLDLILIARKDVMDRNLATAEEKEKIFALGDLNELFAVMDSLQKRAISKRLAESQYSVVKDALDNIGWTVEDIVDASRAIVTQSESDNHNSGEYALIKASARSSAEVTYNGKILALENAGKDLENDSNTVYYAPADIPADGLKVDLTLEIMGTRRAANLAGYHSTNESMITFGHDESNNIINMTIKPNVKGDAVITLMRDPDGTNNAKNVADWVARFKIVVANKLDTPVKPVWGTDESVGKLSWKPVDNAKSYKVNIYKDGTLIDTKDVTSTEIDLNELLSANGNGSYTADVTAYGDNDYEVSGTSEKSDAFDYTSGLAQVAKPVWKSVDDKILSWNGVENADKYVVSFYKNLATEPFATKEVTAVDGENTLDCTDIFAGQSGTFYATVQAKSNDGKVGAVSEKSDGIVIEKLYTITGNVKLESGKGTRTDNSDISVTLYGGAAPITVKTDKDGNYTFSGVAEGAYSIYFEKEYYLRKIVAVNSFSENTVKLNDYVLYFGDIVYGTNVRIDSFDVSSYLKYVGMNDGNADFIPAIDVNEDGAIDIRDLRVILKNIGKKPID